MNSVTGSIRRRTACDECRIRKVKCSGTEPCLNCQNDRCPCTFSNSKPPGRPRKRPRPTGEDCFAAADTPTTTATVDTFNYNEVLNQDPFLDLPDFLSNETPEIPPSTPSFPNIALPISAPCTCLSLAYLTITRLQFPTSTTNDLSTSLADLHSSLASASTILKCTQCSKQMITAMQNLYQLSTLLISIVGRMQTILTQADASASANQHHPDSPHPPQPPITAFPGQDGSNGEAMTRHQFRLFLRKLLRDTILGTASDTGESTLMGVLFLFEKRQREWHEDPHMYEEQAKLFGKRTATDLAHDCQSRVCYVLIERLKTCIMSLDL